MKDVIYKFLPEVLVLAETKIDSSFTTQQFLMSDFYYEPTRIDLSKNSGGMLEYIKKGVIRTRLEKFELKTFESIASEITINKQRYFVLSFYRTEREENKGKNVKRFISELSDILTQVFQIYDNVILMGDLNIDLDDKKIKVSKRYMILWIRFHSVI